MISQMNDFLLITSTLKTMYGTDYPFRCFGLKTGIIYGRGNPSPTKSGSRFSEFFRGRRGRRPLLLYNFSFSSIRRYVENRRPLRLLHNLDFYSLGVYYIIYKVEHTP